MNYIATILYQYFYLVGEQRLKRMHWSSNIVEPGQLFASGLTCNKTGDVFNNWPPLKIDSRLSNCVTSYKGNFCYKKPPKNQAFSNFHSFDSRMTRSNRVLTEPKISVTRCEKKVAQFSPKVAQSVATCVFIVQSDVVKSA